MTRITVPAGAVVTIAQPSDEDKVKEALKHLLGFKHEGDKRIFNKKNAYYEKGDEHAEFFTECYLYPLFEDKDAARTLLGRINRLVEALGYDFDEVSP